MEKEGEKRGENSFFFGIGYTPGLWGVARPEKWGLGLLINLHQALVEVWAADSNKRTHTLLDKQRALSPRPWPCTGQRPCVWQKPKKLTRGGVAEGNEKGGLPLAYISRQKAVGDAILEEKRNKTHG